MTAQEQQMLQGLTDRVNQTQLAEKDADAEQFLARTLGRNPDALYILSQTVLVQQYALDNAKQQLDQAKQQLANAQTEAQQPKHSTSFLGNLLHLNDEPAHPVAPPPPPRQQGNQPPYTPVQTYAPQPAYGQPSYAQPGSVQPSMFGGAQAPQSGGFLRSAMQTATGVAAGALAFEGIESLMHGFGGGGGFGGGSGFGGFGGGGRPEEVVNNYYGDSGSQGHSDLADRLSPDVEDRRDDGSGTSSFADTADSNDDNTSNDSADDSSSFDDGSDAGSDFDSGGSDDNSF